MDDSPNISQSVQPMGKSKKNYFIIGVLLLLLVIIGIVIYIFVIKPGSTIHQELVSVKNGKYYWPDSCKGIKSPFVNCILGDVELTETEVAAYNDWVSKCTPSIEGCSAVLNKEKYSTDICWNEVVSDPCTNTPDCLPLSWRDGCKGSTKNNITCTQALVTLTQDEIAQWEAWISAGQPAIANCTTDNIQTVSVVTKARNEFGFDIYKKLVETDKTKNLMMSPVSIALALSMAYEGADGNTKAEMSSVLKLTEIDMKTLEESSKAFLESYENLDPNVKLAIANSIWTKKSETFAPEFLDINKTYFKSDINSRDFADPKVLKEINDWIAGKTNQKILNMLDKIPADAVMYLINAVYFKGDWKYTFDTKNTKEQDFTTINGTVTKVQMMSQTRTDFKYYTDKQGLQIVELPYGSNSRLSMFIILPDTMQKLYDTLNFSKLESYISMMSEKEGTIFMPSFKNEYKVTLNDALQSLGMKDAFSAADFSKMRADKSKDLVISKVIHQTYIEVNEQGTEAAAATIIEVLKTSAGEDGPFTMNINKPFFYVIRDNTTKDIFFIGQVVAP